MSDFEFNEPDVLGEELRMVREQSLSYSTMNQAACAARFLYEVVLGRSRAEFLVPMAKVPQRQPDLLGRGEIAQLLLACGQPRQRMLLQTVYAAGLRVSEACALELHDTAIATSGDYRHWRERDGTVHSHTMDPHSGAPLLSTLTSVSVICTSCMYADAWATALLVLGDGPPRPVRVGGVRPGDRLRLRLRALPGASWVDARVEPAAPFTAPAAATGATQRNSCVRRISAAQPRVREFLRDRHAHRPRHGGAVALAA